MILLTFGLLVISSLWLAVAWGRVVSYNRAEWSLYNAALLMSLGLTIHSVTFAAQLAIHIDEVIFHGIDLTLVHPYLYHTAAISLVGGKALLVWVAAMQAGREYSKRIWFSYLTAVAAWCGFAAYWNWG